MTRRFTFALPFFILLQGKVMEVVHCEVFGMPRPNRNISLCKEFQWTDNNKVSTEI